MKTIHYKFNGSLPNVQWQQYPQSGIKSGRNLNTLSLLPHAKDKEDQFKIEDARVATINMSVYRYNFKHSANSRVKGRIRGAPVAMWLRVLIFHYRA